MKFQRVLLSVIMAFASLEPCLASAFIGIAADGSEEEFQIGKVRSIKFDPQNSGDKGFRTIVFNSNNNSGIAEKKSSTMAILVYPNPVSEYIIVSGIDDGDEILVYRLEGTIVSRTKNNIVNVREFPSGNYILSVKNKSVKFIKK